MAVKNSTRAENGAKHHDDNKRVSAILRTLKKTYPDATCELNFQNPLQLLIATILAAQCTDARVNQLTPALFKKYKTARDFAEAEPEELEEDIRSTGFYRQKTKSIINACGELIEKHKGKVPANMDAMVALPGVGRKTANVVLGTAMGIPTGIVVDTHVKRVSWRLELTGRKNPDKIEKDLMAVVPEKRWISFGHEMTLHGRRVCLARKPRCMTCPLEKHCPKRDVP
jgi:endonuclease-3